MKLREALLRWFDEHARDLPFRRTRDPYAIWVSEIMLQQTRVDTVLPYYQRFMQRFPTVSALAAAPEDEVMSLWSGLGYYRRARLLHKGVKEVAAHYGGQVPHDADARRALPGIGRYTAGAIGSIAFDRPEPLVDGNVARVFCRFYGITTPLGHKDTEAQLWAHAEKLVQGPRPGALNQAIMELGATLCAKRNPQCELCPLQADCNARRTNRTAELPVPRKRPAPKPVRLLALLATSDRGRRVWLTRGAGALFGGLWNLPTTEASEGLSPDPLLHRLGLKGRAPLEPTATFVHTLTHRRLEVEVFRVATTGGEVTDQLRKASVDELPSLGISSLTRKALQHGSFGSDP